MAADPSSVPVGVRVAAWGEPASPAAALARVGPDDVDRAVGLVRDHAGDRPGDRPADRAPPMGPDDDPFGSLRLRRVEDAGGGDTGPDQDARRDTGWRAVATSAAASRSRRART